MGLGANPSAGGGGLASMGGQKPPGQQNIDYGQFRQQQNPGYQYSLGSMGGAQVNTDTIKPSTAPVSSVAAGQQYMPKMQDAYYNQAKSRLDPQWNQRQSSLETQIGRAHV